MPIDAREGEPAPRVGGLLAELQARIDQPGTDLKELTDELLANLQDGRIKLFLLYQTLNFRRAHSEVVSQGDYLPLEAIGQGFACQQTVKKTGCKSVAAAHTVVNINLPRGRNVGLAPSPGYGTPTVPVGRVDLAQRSCHDFDLRVFFDYAINHS